MSSTLKTWEWKNDAGEIVEHDHWSEPPALPGDWQRVYSVGIGAVSGAGLSPAKTSSKSSSGHQKPA